MKRLMQVAEAVHRRGLIVFVLVMGQIALLGGLLALSGREILVLLVAPGLLLALLCSWLWAYGRARSYRRMALAMLAAGGFGMLSGGIADLGPMGLYDLLAFCFSTPSSGMNTVAAQFWQKLQFTPWTYAGMLLGGNLGMFWLGDLRPGVAGDLARIVRLYAVCNIGMLLGMVGAEGLMGGLLVAFNPLPAAGLMVIVMLAGMIFGMLGLLALANSVTKHGWSPSV